MFERFTDRARRVVVHAQDEARARNHNYIGTEHILLALVQEDDSLAVRTISALDVNPDDLRASVDSIIGGGPGAAAGHIPFTPRAKKALELSLR
jgi:ATP-dependent Clp protease ATP-binding subunit ClpC